MSDKKIEDFLYNKTLIYLGKFPSTKKGISQYLKNYTFKQSFKKKFNQSFNFNLICENIITKLETFNLINESQYLESLINFYGSKHYSIKQIKLTLQKKGFETDVIDIEFHTYMIENPDYEINNLKRFMKRKGIINLEVKDDINRIFKQGFSEKTIARLREII